MGLLLPAHAEQLRASAIADDIRDGRGYRSIDDQSDLVRLGFADYQAIVPGLLIPHWGVTGGNGSYAYRPDNPRTKAKPTGESKPVKYEFPAGSRVALDCHPACRELLDDPAVPIWFVEGTKKADAGLSARSPFLRCVVSVSGVYNWRTTNKKGGTVASPDFEAIALNKRRRAYICFDNDPAPRTKKNVSDAASRLGRHLQSKGADVWIVTIPPIGNGKGALDDYLAAGGTVEELAAIAKPTQALAKIREDDAVVEAEGDIALADRILVKHRDDFRYSPPLGHFRWDGRRWLLDQVEGIEKMVEAAVRDINDEIVSEPDPDRKAALAKLLSSHSKAERQRGALVLARRHVAFTPDEMDADPYLIAAANGVVDLKSGELRPPQREDLISKLVPIDYLPDARAPRWSQFLEEIFDRDYDLIEYIKRSAGYSLTGDQREKCFWFMYGPTDTGKTTFSKILLAAAGEYGQAGPVSLFLAERQSQISSDVARLKGARLVVVSETAQNRAFDAEKLKKLTGTDKITARFMYKDWFDFWPTHHLWLLSNYRPKASASDGALWNRVKLVPFQVVFEGRAGAPHLKDPSLYEWLLGNELAGIFAWLVQGAVRWFEYGLEEPEKVRVATDAYRTSEDGLAAFIKATIDMVNGASEKTSAVWKAYQLWSEGERHMMGRQHFNAALRDLYGFTQTDRGDAWRNIRLRPGAAE